MAKHKVILEVPAEQELRSEMTFVIKRHTKANQYNEVFGKLIVTKTGVLWRPKHDKSGGQKKNWKELAQWISGDNPKQVLRPKRARASKD